MQFSNPIETATPAQPGAACILVVGSHEAEHSLLTQILRACNWNVLSTRSYHEASACMRAQVTPLVVCECCLPDGSWKDMLAEASRYPVPPVLIVTSRLADDRLWAEVLNLGGYDVLTEPLDASEVRRSVGLAWAYWKRQCDQHALQAVGTKMA